MSAAVRFVIRTSAASVPSNVKAPYVHIAVMAVEPGYVVHEISDRRPGRKVVAVWRRLNVGRMVTSAAAKARAEAEEMLPALRQKHINDLIAL
jgi:hypothetical protein